MRIQAAPAPTFSRDDALDQALDIANMVDVLNELCPTGDTANMGRERGGLICDPRPGMADTHPSFAVDRRKGRWLFLRFGSGTASGRADGGNCYHLLTSMGFSPRDAAKWLIDYTGVQGATDYVAAPRYIHDPIKTLRDDVAKWTLTPHTAEVWKHGTALELRGFSSEDSEKFGLHESADGGILIPIFDPLGQLQRVKRRNPDGAAQRYFYLEGGTGSPPWCSLEQGLEAPILMVEGEFNAIALASCTAYQIIGLAGTNGKFNPDWVKDRNVFVYCDADPDGNGDQAKTRLVDLVKRAGGAATALPALEWPLDFNDILRDQGKEALAKIVADLIEGSPAPKSDHRLPSLAAVWAEDGVYCTFGPPKARGKDDFTIIKLTNWVMAPIARLLFPDGRRGVRGSISTLDGRELVVDVPSEAWNSRKDLLEVLGPLDCLFVSVSNAHVSLLRSHLLHLEQEENLPSIVGIETYGEHLIDGQRVSVYDDGVLTANGEQENPCAVYAGAEGLSEALHKMPPQSDPVKARAALAALVKSLSLINSNTALAIAAKCVAGLFAARTSRLYGNRLPMLAVSGERESGKSSFVELWMRATTGNTNRTVKAPSVKTEFQYDAWFSNQNNQIAVLDEYNPEHIDETLLKGHYDISVKRRGTGIRGKTATFFRNSPLIILGQHDILDAALKSRAVLYGTDPKERGGSAAYAQVFSAPLEHLARPMMQFALGISDEVLGAWFSKSQNLVRAILGDREPRLEMALIDLAIGCQAMEVFGFGGGWDVQKMLEVGIENTLQGGAAGGGQKGSIEVALEQGAYALSRVPSETWWSFLAIPDGDQSGGSVIIRSNMFVELIKEKFKGKAAVTSGVMFGKLAAQLDWIECPTGGTKKSGGKSVRGVVVHRAECPGRCDLDGLWDVVDGMCNTLSQQKTGEQDD